MRTELLAVEYSVFVSDRHDTMNEQHLLSQATSRATRTLLTVESELFQDRNSVVREACFP